VTGEPGVGISLSWDDAVRAQVGRLLAYAIPKGGGKRSAARTDQGSTRSATLPDNRRGCAQTIEGLAGTWAADENYADKITRIANDIHGAAQRLKGCKTPIPGRIPRTRRRTAWAVIWAPHRRRTNGGPRAQRARLKRASTTLRSY
jgi:hypothetical protein